MVVHPPRALGAAGELVGGSGAVGTDSKAKSVALSADGNTAIVGGHGIFYRSNRDKKWPDGAAWVFIRSGGVWTQQGRKLVGSGAVGGAWQGHSVGSQLMATPPSWAGEATAHTAAARYGCSSEVAACGRSKGANWSVQARLEKRRKAGPSRSRLTAIPRSSVGMVR